MATSATQSATNGKVVGVVEQITIAPPNFQHLVIQLRGTAPYLQARMSEKAMRQMKEKQEAGSTAKKGRAREARDFAADYRAAMHLTADGHVGIPAAAFRNAAIDACRMTGYAMTRAKMSLFVQADGLDALDGTPLVFIEGDEPERVEMPVRNASGVADIRVRPMWRSWSVNLRVTYDADQFTSQDVVNLIHRAGVQVGVGEGRPFSKQSNGLGYGLFEIVNPEGVGA